MNKLTWVILGVILPVLCFSTLYFFITSDDYRYRPKPEITVNTLPTTSTITWYTSIPQRHAERLANAFRAETGIDVDIFRDSTFIVRERLISEIENGATEADIITIADIGTFIELRDQGYLMKYTSPHYRSYGEEYKEPGYWVVFAGFGICMAYDESRIDTPPQHWIDLLDERWKGRIGLEDINTAGSQYGQYYMLREKLGIKFWEELLSVQQPKIYYRTEELANALLEGEIDIAGEFSIHIVYSYRVNRGTSIQGIYPEEGIPLVVNPTAIMNHTDQPREAKIFLDFLLSQKGQELMQRLNYKYSVRGEVTPLEGIPSFGSLNILQPEDMADYAGKRSEYIQEFNRFLGNNK
jgi:iron(III) transport system substrate-binding protein